MNEAKVKYAIIESRYNKLKAILKDMGEIMVAFSGGVDSTFLIKVAYDILKDRAVAITARSSTYPEREFNEAVDFVTKHGIKHIIIDSEELDIEGFSLNPRNRCYFCKKELFSKIRQIADQQGIRYIADGSNTDDLNDYRPGMLAHGELGIRSPLKEAEMSKEDIRILSREMGLPTWDKPSFACLASRFPYGQQITKEKLGMVDRAEQYLLDIGFKQVRVRHHGEIARIEVSPAERSRFFDNNLLDEIYLEFSKIGFKYTALDLKGYRTGSMNE